MTLRVAVIGAKGRIGSEAVKAVEAARTSIWSPPSGGGRTFPS